jgi:hypothetical protein
MQAYKLQLAKSFNISSRCRGISGMNAFVPKGLGHADKTALKSAFHHVCNNIAPS